MTTVETRRVCASPVGDPDTLDIVGVRDDGGLDLVISAVAALDDSPSTLAAVEQKVRNYVIAGQSEAMLRYYDREPGACVSIYISCAFPIAAAAQELIDRLREEALQTGIGLEVRSYMGDMH
jgi:hypothetical protein